MISDNDFEVFSIEARLNDNNVPFADSGTVEVTTTTIQGNALGIRKQALGCEVRLLVPADLLKIDVEGLPNLFNISCSFEGRTVGGLVTWFIAGDHLILQGDSLRQQIIHALRK